MIDKNVERVCDKLRQRSRVGIDKYGTTTDLATLDALAWIKHLHEELMDATVYIEALLNTLGEKKETHLLIQQGSSLKGH